jgi:uncharacterized membrane protein (GlpM family)
MTGIEVKPAELTRPKASDWLVRFAFGAGVSGLAGVVAALAGPLIGGIFLAFPAILLASLTLIAEEDGVRQARDDARGATLGTAGLLVFALVLVATATRWPLWAALTAAAAAWTIVSLGLYAVARATGHGDDEPNSSSAR